MYIVCVTIWVKPDHVEEFIQATAKNHQGAVKEPGCLRFDVLQAEENPSRFFLYEVYRDKADLASHQQTEHYLQWRKTVADWMAEPREGIKYQLLFPAAEDFS
jgi:autoinducer 2-degrading protein